MNENIQARMKFIQEAIAGSLSPEQAKERLDQFQQEFGEDAFLPGKVTKKPQPWDQTYLNELEMEAVSGAASREFLMHLAEVGAFVKRDTKKKQTRKRMRIFCLIVAFIAVIAILAAFFHALQK